jgi:hypothetical protein
MTWFKKGILIILMNLLFSHETGLTATLTMQQKLLTIKNYNTMIFEKLIKVNQEAFINKVKEISTDLGIEPEHLMFVMYFETGGTFSPSITNSIGATGLIQFLPSTAKGLGTSTTDLRHMTNVEQLNWVHKYLMRWRGKIADYVDLYLAVFYPAAVAKPDTYTIPYTKVAQQNPGFDLNKDGYITKAEIRQKLFNRIPEQYKPYFK